MSHEIKEVELSRIYLDNNNPRHDPIENEQEIINYLLKNERVKPLARHIAEAGNMSPLERLAVVAHPKVKGAYIAAAVAYARGSVVWLWRRWLLQQYAPSVIIL